MSLVQAVLYSEIRAPEKGSVECSPGVDKARGGSLALLKLGNSIALEVEAGDPKVQGHGGQL